MTYPVSQFLNTVGSGGTSTSPFLNIFAQRDPTGYDYNYPVAKRWINTLTVQEFILLGFISTSGVMLANWQPIGSASSTESFITNLPSPSGTVVPNPANSSVYVNASTSTYTDGSTPYTLKTEVQGTLNQLFVGQGSLTPATTLATSNTSILLTNGSGVPAWSAAPLSVSYGGTGAVSLTGVLIGNGTGAVTGNPITQYDVLVGGASNSIASISPVTAGDVFVSGGAAANPLFSANLTVNAATGAVTIPRTLAISNAGTVTRPLSVMYAQSAQYATTGMTFNPAIYAFNNYFSGSEFQYSTLQISATTGNGGGFDSYISAVGQNNSGGWLTFSVGNAGVAFEALSVSNIGSLRGISTDGSTNFYQMTGQVTTIGTNGSATALTANPVGYITTFINGTQYQIPYYNHA